MSRSTILLVSFVACALSACFATAGPPIDPAASGKALVVMDMQQDFVSPQARLPIASSQVPSVIDAVNRAAQTFDQSERPVIYVANAFDPDDTIANWFRNDAALAGTSGAELDSRVDVRSTDLYYKSEPDAFSNTDLDQALRERHIGHLVFVGVFADQCLYWSARGALNRGYQVTVIAEGVGAATDGDRRDALEDLRALGVQIISVDALSQAFLDS